MNKVLRTLHKFYYKSALMISNPGGLLSYQKIEAEFKRADRKDKCVTRCPYLRGIYAASSSCRSCCPAYMTQEKLDFLIGQDNFYDKELDTRYRDLYVIGCSCTTHNRWLVKFIFNITYKFYHSFFTRAYLRKGFGLPTYDTLGSNMNTDLILPVAWRIKFQSPIRIFKSR